MSGHWCHRKVGIAGFLFLLAMVGAAEADTVGEDQTLDPHARFDPAVYTDGWLTSDRNADGIVDYAVKVDEKGNKVREAVDFNRDGLMDDFYFYSNDVLQRQEVDSNFDEAIDIWIFLWRGVYVQRWERDTDYDGEVDVVRDYDEQE